MNNRLASAGQASLIPVRATGNIGSDFFKQPQAVGSSLQLLKKKQRHNELREKGYLVDDDPKEKTEEIDMDLPFYEVFDPPNQNYLKVFHPSNLEAKVAYNYHSPDFEQNEVFLISKEDQAIADSLLKGAQENARRKEAILLKMNQNYQREKEIKELKEKQQIQNEMINQLKQEKFNKKSVTFKDQKKKTKK